MRKGLTSCSPEIVPKYPANTTHAPEVHCVTFHSLVEHVDIGRGGRARGGRGGRGGKPLGLGRPSPKTRLPL